MRKPVGIRILKQLLKVSRLIACENGLRRGRHLSRVRCRDGHGALGHFSYMTRLVPLRARSQRTPPAFLCVLRWMVTTMSVLSCRKPWQDPVQCPEQTTRARSSRSEEHTSELHA